MRILRLAQAAFAAATLTVSAGSAHAAGGEMHYEAQNWSFSGIFGTIDAASAQRGYQVYRSVCAGCHSMELMSFRFLEGIGLPDHTIKVLASEADVATTDSEGEATTRSGLPSDRFPSPFANEKQARALNNGALPPDLSLIAKSRGGGADYLYALLTGYVEPPPSVEMNEGMYYNTAFEGHQIAMAPPLSEGLVEYSDETPATVDQMARDVTTFMAYVAEPHRDERKRTGLKVVLFLVILSVLLYFVKKRVWADVH